MPIRAANMRLLEATDRYLQRITAEGQSERSVYTARAALARFAKWLAVRQPRDPNPFLHLIPVSTTEDYFFGPLGIRQGVAAITFNRYRSVLKVFFGYAILMRWVDTSPMAAIAPARPDAPKQQLMLNASELLALMDHTGHPVERIACALGMNTGMRANDVRHLTIFDVSLASGTIQTEIRKTRKYDIKPITMDLRPELERWLDRYAELSGFESRQDLPDHWLLVPALIMLPPRVQTERIRLKPLQKHTQPWRLVQRPLRRMGYPTKGTGFHTLRRSSARAFFESLRASGEGRDHALMIVKEYLNHASTMMTEQYLGLNYERTIRDGLLKDKSFLGALAAEEQAKLNPSIQELRRGA